MEDESTELARRAIKGDRPALEELWRLHRRWLAAVVLAHRAGRAETDDLLQDVALAVVRNIAQLRDPALVRPWLRAVAVNSVRTSARRQAAGPVTHNGHAGHPEPETASIAPAETRTGGERAALNPARLLELALGLPVHYREPLLLRALRDLSVRHIAEAMDLPEKTIETRLLRARRLLCDAVAMEEDRTGATRLSDTPHAVETRHA